MMIALAAVIGWAAATTTWGLGLMVLFPALSYVQSTRRRSFAVAFAYYAAASHILIPSATAFFGPHNTPAAAALLWMLSSTLLATPYMLLWSKDRRQAIWRIPIAILASIPPPLGLIGWASPLTSAGILYPGSGWFGVGAVLLAPGLLAVLRTRSVVLLSVATAVGAAAHSEASQPPSGWEVVTTNFPLANAQPLDDYAVAQTVHARLRSSTSRVMVFGETVLPVWTEATEALWAPALENLSRNGRVILIGTTIPIGDSDRYRNVILARGAEAADIEQHVPVPIGMWRPFLRTGVPLNLTGPSIMFVAGQRVAPLICYEQFLTMPILIAAAHKPTVLLALSNTAWSGFSTITDLQHRLCASWATLFGVPLLFASND